MLAAVRTIDLGRDCDLDPGGIEDIDDPLLGIIGTIGEQRPKAANHLWEQGIDAVQIMKAA